MRLPFILTIVLATAGAAGTASAADTDKNPNEERHEMKEELGEYPRIAQSIKAIDKAIEDLRKAPHDFGGHREAAIKACEDAKKQMRAALDYRSDKEEKKEDKK